MNAEFFLNRDVLIVMLGRDGPIPYSSGRRWHLIVRAHLVLSRTPDSTILLVHKLRSLSVLDDDCLRHYGVPLVLPSAVAIPDRFTKGAVQISKADHFALEVMAGWYS